MLDGIPLADLTAPTLLGFTVLMILLGWLVPKSTYKGKAEEAEKWRLAYEAEREARKTADSQTTELLELAKTTNSIVVAAFGGSVSRQSGEGHVVSTPPSK